MGREAEHKKKKLDVRVGRKEEERGSLIWFEGNTDHCLGGGDGKRPE